MQEKGPFLEDLARAILLGDPLIVQSAAQLSCIAKHGNAREFGGMSPRKILKNRCSDIEFGDTLESLMTIIIMCINFKIQIKF